MAVAQMIRIDVESCWAVLEETCTSAHEASWSARKW